MNRFLVETQLRKRLEDMTAAQFDQVVLDLLDNIREAAKTLALATDRQDVDAITAEMLAFAAIRRPTDVAYLRVAIPAYAPELATHLLQYFPNEQWLAETAAQGRGVKPEQRQVSDFVEEQFRRMDEADDRWLACKKEADAPGATHQHRLAELTAHAELHAGATYLAYISNQVEAYAKEQLLSAVAAMSTCMCIPDAAMAEPFQGVQPIWRDYPAGFEDHAYERQTGGGLVNVLAGRLDRRIAKTEA